MTRPAVVPDFDGTLVTDQKLLTERTKAAVAALHRRGIIFSIISIRGLRMVLDVLEIMVLDALEINVPFGGFNAGGITGPDLSSLTNARVAALLVTANSYFDVRRDRIVGFAAHQRLPAIYQFREYSILPMAIASMVCTPRRFSMVQSPLTCRFCSRPNSRW